MLLQHFRNNKSSFTVLECPFFPDDREANKLEKVMNSHAQLRSRGDYEKTSYEWSHGAPTNGRK